VIENGHKTWLFLGIYEKLNHNTFVNIIPEFSVRLSRNTITGGFSILDISLGHVIVKRHFIACQCVIFINFCLLGGRTPSPYENE
jgi:hypothetical protein